MKRFIGYTSLVLLTLGILLLLWQFRQALILFVLSLAFGATFRPAFEALAGRGWPRGLAILATYGVGLGTLILLIILASGPFFTELQEATDSFALSYTRFQTEGLTGTAFQKALAEQLPPLNDLYDAIGGEQGAVVAESLLGVASGLAGFLSQLTVVVVLSIYWSLDKAHFERLWLSMLPAEQRRRASKIWRGIENGVGAYIRSEVIQSILAAVILWLAYSAIGLEYPTLLALVSALAWLIPLLGALLAIVPVFLVGLGTSLAMAVIGVLVTLLVLLGLENYVEPRIFHRRRYSALLIVLLVIALSDAFGLIGLIVAPPVAAAIQIFFRNLMGQPRNEAEPGSRERVLQIRARLEDLRPLAETDSAGPQIQNLFKRLDSLVEKTEETLLTGPNAALPEA